MQNDKICNKKMDAFTYIELIIAMSIVVIVVILSAPLLSGMSKTKINPFGEYICYARYINGKWRLYQNQRLNVQKYADEDTLLALNENCKFEKLSGNISNYTITLYGAGGSGSAPYYDKDTTQASNGKFIFISAGQDGLEAEKRTISVNLNEIITSDVLTIKLCDSNSDDETCVGRGGDVNTAYGSSYAKYEKTENTVKSLLDSNTLSQGDINYLLNLSNADINTALTDWQANNSEKNKNQLIEAINNCNKEENDKNSGHSGVNTQLKMSSNTFIVAKGGQYGLSDLNTNFTKLDVSDVSLQVNNILRYPDTINPEIKNNKYDKCDGEDANTVMNGTSYNNYGKPGKAGAFVCKLPVDTTNFNTTNSNTNYCYSCHGGRGAGGAIVIQWN